VTVEVSAPQTPVVPSGPAWITVSELNARVRGAIAAALPGDIHVVGELSNVTRAASGHHYFTLKDATSEVRCAMWASDARSLRFQPTDGLAVIATGNVDLYEQRGQYQFYVRRLEPRGVGALELAFRQLKEKLQREGLFDPARKRKLPRIPRRIAVVTSIKGAAIRDILQTIARRYPRIHVLVHDVRVQGEGSAAEVAAAIRRINACAARLGGIDAMIVGRGGGSMEDLWAFNEEVVARAIHDSAIPIVSAVGHEVDYTIADFVADVRAATPTAAAELVVPTLAELIGEIDTASHRLARAMAAGIDARRARLTLVERAEWFRDPIGLVRRRHQQVDEVGHRLRLAKSRRLSLARKRLHELEVRLLRCRPEAVLERRRLALTRATARLQQVMTLAAVRAEKRLAEGVRRWAAVSPRTAAQRSTVLLEQFEGRLGQGLRMRMQELVRVLAVLEERLIAGSPERVLARGFSITRKKAGGIVATPVGLREGERIVTETAGGEVESEVRKGNAEFGMRNAE